MLKWIKSIAAITTLGVLAACGGGDDGPHSNIVQTAQGNAQLSILKSPFVGLSSGAVC